MLETFGKVIGTASGYLPARRAASLDPVDDLCAEKRGRATVDRPRLLVRPWSESGRRAAGCPRPLVRPWSESGWRAAGSGRLGPLVRSSVGGNSPDRRCDLLHADC